VVLAQLAQVLVELLDTLLVRLDTLALEALVELEVGMVSLYPS